MDAFSTVGIHRMKTSLLCQGNLKELSGGSCLEQGFEGKM